MAQGSPSERSPRFLQVGARGRLVLPASVRKQLDVREGDRLILTVDDDGSLRLVNARAQLQKLRGLYRHLAPGTDLAEELVRERRAEAAGE